MIGSIPMVELAPLDYRIALDAAAVALAETAPLIVCELPRLRAEAAQRVAEGGPVASALWVEPMLPTWQAELVRLSVALPMGAQMALVVSQPMARLLPERRGWGGQPLGTRLGGMAQLRGALRRAGWRAQAEHGFHTLDATILNIIGRQFERHNRADLADKLGFEARLRYSGRGLRAALSTVALIIAQKEGQL